MANIYLVTYIQNIYRDTFELEIINLGYTQMPEEGIIEYVNNIYGFKNYDIVYSYLDLDHFKEICHAINEKRFL